MKISPKLFLNFYIFFRNIHDAISHSRLFLRIVETNGTVALRKVIVL